MTELRWKKYNLRKTPEKIIPIYSVKSGADEYTWQVLQMRQTTGITFLNEDGTTEPQMSEWEDVKCEDTP